MPTNRMNSRLFQVLAMCLAAALFQVGSSAQVTTATLQGLVLDPSGAAIPGAEVTLSNEATGQELSGASSMAGEFAITFVPPGTYTVLLTAEGFKSTSVEGLQLATGQRANVNYTLEIGATTETVTVTGAAPLMNTVNAEQDISLNETQVDELPMINRDITGILSLGTGAAMTDGGWTMSINGLAPRGFTMTVDAVDAVPDAEFAGLALYQNFNFIKGISIEAVREVETSKNIFSAETGNTIAGNVNLISKSGTNDFHGSLFEMYQSGGLHARNHIVARKSPLVYHQYGVSLGGPIARNKTFFFGVFEGYRFNRLTPLSGDVWSSGMRERIRQAVPAAQPYLDLWPAPTEEDGPNLDPSHTTCGELGPNVPCIQPTAQFAGNGTENRKDDHAVVKVDHNVNQSNFLTFRYVRSRPLRRIPRLQLGNWRTWDGIQENGAFTWTRLIGPSLTSETRWGTNVNAINRLDGAYAADEIPFLRGFGGPGDSGAEVFAKDGHTSTLEQNFSKTAGRHVIKFGGMFRYMSGTRINEESPIYTYATQSDLLSGRITSARYVFPLEKFTWRRWFVGGFVQDDIRLKPNFMLNLGLRWDYASVPRSSQNEGIDGNIFNRDGPFGRPGATLRTAIGRDLLFRPPNRFWDAIYNMFSPRLGFAWTLDDSGKTVVRGGAGIFYMPHNIFAGPIDVITNGPDVPSHLNVVGDAVQNLGLQYGDPNEVGMQAATAAATIGGNSVDPQWAAPYSAQFTAGIQRQVTDSMVLDVGYVGNRGVHLIFNPTYNRLLPHTEGKLYSEVLGLQDFQRFNFYQGADSTGYHSLQTSMKKRFSQNLQFNVNYTYAWNWAHFRGDMTCCTGGNDPQTVWSPTRGELYDMKLNRAPTHYHIRHRFTTDFYYEIPVPGNVQGAGRHILGGWTLAGILEMRTGTPLRITQGGTQSPGQRPDIASSSHAAAIRSNYTTAENGRYQYLDVGAFSLVPTDSHRIALRPGTLSRYAIYGPGLWNLDASIAKRIEISEAQRLMLRVDLFNALNNTVLGGIQTNAASGTFGRLRSSLDGRKVQLQIRFEF